TRTARLPTVPVSWRAPLTVTLVAMTAAAVVVNSVVATPTVGPPIDYTLFGLAGSHILTGQWVGIFSGSLIQAGPLELTFWGVPFLIGFDSQIGWITFSIVASTVFSILFALLTQRLLRPLAPTWSTPLAIVATFLAAVSGQPSQTLAAGHPAEFVIPLMWIVSATLARRGSAFSAALVLAATAGWELWGLLGVPVLLFAPSIDLRTVWRSALGGVTALVVLFAPFVLLGPFRMFSFAWPIRDDTLAHLLFPRDETFPWPLRLAQGVLSIGVGAIIAVLARRRPDAVWLVPLAVCAIRLFTDPVLARYYAVPSLMMILIGLVFAIAQRSLAVFIACLLMFNLLIDAQLTVLTVGIFVILVIATAVFVVRDARRLRRGPWATVGASR
ncbi:MAG: hypothetical protein M3N46_00930, partial [Actinomycetota bacterium]|nr:hypothetical protein [Actinomycetota bacterium]